MSNPTLENGELITRDAHVALTELKILVDRAAERLRVAERETVGVAIGYCRNEDPLRTLRDAADALQSPKFRSRGFARKRKDAERRQLASGAAESVRLPVLLTGVARCRGNFQSNVRRYAIAGGLLLRMVRSRHPSGGLDVF